MTHDDRVDVRDGVDTDHDGLADTLLVPDQFDLTLAVDTDRDGLADLVVQVGPDAVARVLPLSPAAVDPPDDACYPDDVGDVSPW